MTALEHIFDPIGLDPGEALAALDAAPEQLAATIAGMRPSWTSRALCAGEPVEWFFPRRGQRPDAAFEICGRCPVREQCLDEALHDDDLDHGIRGGATAAARKAMRRARGIVIAKAVSCAPGCRCDDCRRRRSANTANHRARKRAGIARTRKPTSGTRPAER